MNCKVYSDIEQYVAGLYTDGFSWEAITEFTIEAFSNEAADDEIEWIIWGIRDHLE